MSIQYRILKRLASKPKEHVFLDVIDIDGGTFVQKSVVQASPSSRRHIKNERQALVRIEAKADVGCSPSFLVRLHSACQSSPNNFHLVLSHGELGDLNQLRFLLPGSCFSVSDARFYMAELCLAVRYLHDTCNILHRDVKCDNIFVDIDGHILLGDLDLAVIMPSYGYTRGIAGTFQFMAPEVARGFDYSYPIDIYSMGMVLLSLITGECRNIPHNATRQEAIMQVASGTVKRPPVSTMDNVLNSILDGMLAYQPFKRPRIAQLMKHQFFEDIDWDRLYEKAYYTPICDVQIIDPPSKKITIFGEPVLNSDFSYQCDGSSS